MSGLNWEHFDLVDSTQLAMQRKIQKQIFSENQLITADRQKNGVGTRNKKWISPKGNLYATFATLPQERDLLFSVLAAETMITAVKEIYGYELTLKHPNDLFFHEGKCGGILCTWQEDLEKKEILCIGIGVNCAYAPKTDQPTSIIKADPKELILKWVQLFSEFIS